MVTGGSGDRVELDSQWVEGEVWAAAHGWCHVHWSGLIPGLDRAAQNGLQGDWGARCILDRSWSFVIYLIKTWSWWIAGLGGMVVKTTSPCRGNPGSIPPRSQIILSLIGTKLAFASDGAAGSWAMCSYLLWTCWQDVAAG